MWPGLRCGSKVGTHGFNSRLGLLLGRSRIGIIHGVLLQGWMEKGLLALVYAESQALFIKRQVSLPAGARKSRINRRTSLEAVVSIS